MIAGIDYSLSSPCICVADDAKPFSFEACQILCCVKNKKLPPRVKNIKILQNYGTDYPQMHRYQYLATNTACFCTLHHVKSVLIEDYAFGATGRTFSIGENCGIMKHMLAMFGIAMTVETPPVIKKFATGKGNANKDLLLQTFTNETSVDLYELLGLPTGRKSIPAPITDVIDAYNMCHLLYERQHVE